MSYLEIAKQAEARLQAARRGYAVDAENAVTGINRVNSVARAELLAEAVPFLGMPLDVFQARGSCLEVHVPWLEVTLWIVPDERHAEALFLDGIARGRVWTAAELMQLMSLKDCGSQIVMTIAHAKLEMAGNIVTVRRPA